MAKQPNLFAGMGSHQSARTGTTTWLTPPEIIESLGSFDLDPCAHPGWPTAKRQFFKDDDGLRQVWNGRVWLNPPYTSFEIRRWFWKMKEHNHGTAMVFARTETKHFFESVWDHAAAVLFIKGRINFYTADGRRSEANAGAPSMLIAYGEYDTFRLSRAEIVGKFVALGNQSWSVIAIPKTWVEVVADAFFDERELSLSSLYERIAGNPKTVGNNHWQAKIRQIVQVSSRFERLRSGVYKLS